MKKAIQRGVIPCVGLFLTAAFCPAQSSWAESCVPAHEFQTITPGKLTVATGELPPFDSLGIGKDYRGVEADILRLVAQKECVTLEPIEVDPSGQVQYVFAGKADIGAFGWYRSAARAKMLNVSDPLLIERLAIYSKDGVTAFSALDGRSVGTIQGYLWVPDLQKIYGSNLKLYPNPVALAQDLSSGRIDAAIDSYTKGVYAQRHVGAYRGLTIKAAQSDPRVKVSVVPSQTTFLLPRNNTALVNAINQDIQNIRANGAMQIILKKYGLDPSVSDVGAPRLAE